MKSHAQYFTRAQLLFALSTTIFAQASLDITPSTLVQAIRIKYCTPAPVPAVLTILKTGPADVNVDAPQDYNYVITVTNSGTVNALNVIVSDTLPTQVTFNSGTASNGGTVSAVGQAVTATLGTLVPGEVVTVTISVHAASQPEIRFTNTAVATSSNGSSVQSSVQTHLVGG